VNESNSLSQSYNRNSGSIRTGFLRQHSALLIRLCSLLDAVVIFGTLYLTLYLFEINWESEHIVIGLAAALVFEIIASFFNLYRSFRVIQFRFELIKIFLYWSLSVILLASVLFFLKTPAALDTIAGLSWYLAAFLVISIVHFTARLITRYARAFGYDVRTAAFVGANDIAVNMMRIYETHTWMGMKNIGVFDDRHVEELERMAVKKPELAGNIDELFELARDGSVDIIYICLPLAAEKRIKTYIDLFSDTTASIYYCPSFSNFDIIQSRWDDVFGQPVISIVESPFVDHQRYVKRLEDIIFVLAAAPLLLPLMLVIGILVKLSSKGPVFFKQNRYGINGKSFKMWKFRSMYIEDCEQVYSQATQNDPRITKLGAYLRKTSLDEIPQFLNVLIGNMSVVGPRPHPDIVNEDLRKKIHRYMVRHKIKPGITGLAQVNGLRGETQSLDVMARRIEQDLQYIRNWSLMLDVKILLKTIFNLGGKNVY